MIFRSILMGSDDYGWFISDVVLEGEDSEVPLLVVHVFLFFQRPGVGSKGRGANIFMLHKWQSCWGCSSMLS